MIAHYETIAIPESPLDNINEHLDDLATLVRPGFIVRANGDGQHVMRAVSEAIGSRTHDMSTPEELDDFSWGWHLDGVLNDEEDVELTIHQTVIGAGRVALLVPKPSLWEYKRKLKLGGYGVPDDLIDLLNNGETNDALTETTVHIGNIAIGDIIVFATDGPKPTLHSFTTTEAPRSSTVHLACIPRTPDL